MVKTTLGAVMLASGRCCRTSAGVGVGGESGIGGDVSKAPLAEEGPSFPWLSWPGEYLCA